LKLAFVPFAVVMLVGLPFFPIVVLDPFALVRVLVPSGLRTVPACAAEALAAGLPAAGVPGFAPGAAGLAPGAPGLVAAVPGLAPGVAGLAPGADGFPATPGFAPGAPGLAAVVGAFAGAAGLLAPPPPPPELFFCAETSDGMKTEIRIAKSARTAFRYTWAGSIAAS
jgi:hypothetical protein